MENGRESQNGSFIKQIYFCLPLGDILHILTIASASPVVPRTAVITFYPDLLPRISHELLGGWGARWA